MRVQFIIHGWGFECRFCRCYLDLGFTPTFEELKTAYCPCTAPNAHK